MASKKLKPQPTEREPSVILKPGMKKIADALLDGKTVTEVAKDLGVSRQHVNQTKLSDNARTYMGHSQQQLADALNIKRGDIVIKLLEVAEEAQRVVDHGSAVRAYTEVAKMLGLYAPEVKELHITTNQRAIISKYEGMSDEELLQLAHNPPIEGEFTTVTGKSH
jgi:DNA-binding XRE family transcriptional regulator